MDNNLECTVNNQDMVNPVCMGNLACQVMDSQECSRVCMVSQVTDSQVCMVNQECLDTVSQECSQACTDSQE